MSTNVVTVVPAANMALATTAKVRVTGVISKDAVDVDDSAAADAQADVTVNTNSTGNSNQGVIAEVRGSMRRVVYVFSPLMSFTTWAFLPGWIKSLLKAKGEDMEVLSHLC